MSFTIPCSLGLSSSVIPSRPFERRVHGASGIGFCRISSGLGRWSGFLEECGRMGLVLMGPQKRLGSYWFPFKTTKNGVSLNKDRPASEVTVLFSI